MTLLLPKIKEKITEQLSRLKLYLHINKQTKKNTTYLRFGIVILAILVVIGLIVFLLSTLIPGLSEVFSPKKIEKNINSTSSPKESQISKPSTQTPQITYELNSYVELVEPSPNPSKSGSINIRETPCGENILGSSNWASVGQIIEGPITQECFGDKWNWYKVKWPSGAIGWSIDNHFQKIEAIRKYSNSGVELSYPFDWQVNESKNSNNQISQILLQKANSKLIINTVSSNSLIGTLDNNQPACVGELKDITDKKENYRVYYGYHEVGEKKDKTSYYKYIDKTQFFTRQNVIFDTLYNKYLAKTQDGLSRNDTNKMPFIDLFDIQVCTTNITPSYTTLVIDGNSKEVYIDLHIKAGSPTNQIIEEADKIVASLNKK